MSTKVLEFTRTREAAYEDVPGYNFLKRHRKTGVYYVRKYRAGKGELFKSTREKTVGRAKTVANLLLDEWLGLSRKAVGRRKTIDEVIDELESSLQEEFKNGDRRAATATGDKHKLKPLRRYFGNVFVDEIDEQYWEDWIRNVGRKQKGTIFDLAKYMSKALTFAHSRKYIGRKPKIRNPDKQKKSGRVYTDDEIGLIVGHADETLLLQIVFGYECGFRTGEVRSLPWANIQFDEAAGTAVVRLTEELVKANAREVEVSPGTYQLLKRRFDKRGKSPFVFPAPKDPLNRCESRKVQNSRWRRAVEGARDQAKKESRPAIEGKAWFYHLRHSFYTKALLELEMPIQTVSEYGGTSIRTLQQRYLHGSAARTRGVAQAIQLPIKRPDPT